jgi:putative photosynthetic complex assembly protein 2
MMTLAAIALVFVLWGGSTAVIFYLDSLPTHTFKWSMGAATLFLVIAFIAKWTFQGDTTIAGITISFSAGLLAWGWTEMALYMGYVTGPRKHGCASGCSGMAHFGHAISANLWHEIAIIVIAAAIWVTGNSTATWCFVMLWLMHLSARLNVFLGVRNISAEFVPPHMDILKSFLRQRNMNPLFPLSCAALMVLICYLALQPHSFEVTMATTLAAIGLLEHVLLMLPLPIERMWHWSLSKQSKTTRVDQSSHKHKSIGAVS